MNNCFYLVGKSSCPRGGIYQYREKDGGLEELSFAPLTGCNWISPSPDGKYMYATCGNGEETPGCAAFRINDDGSLAFLNQLSSEGKAPCYTVVSADGKFLYCANYLSGSVTEFRLADDGSIAERAQVITHTGKGPNQPRQDGPHTHFAEFTPDGKFLIVIDLGIDAVKLYPWSETGIDAAGVRTFSVPAGCGPRHLVFNNAGTIAYLVTELGNTVLTLSYDGNGNFVLLNEVSTLPEHYSGATKAAAIRLSPDERYLYVSNRGYDSIACYELDPETKIPVWKGLAASGGDGPRDINYLPGYQKFAAANEFSDVVVFYDVKAENGMLYPDGNMVRIPGPLAIFRSK